MQPCRFLEMHVADGCNLACESCAHFANYLSGGLLSPDDAESQMKAWSARLAPGVFTMFGGEPCLNPDLTIIIDLAWQYWPNTRRQVLSNGVLLGDIPGLAPALLSTRTELAVTRHSPDVSIDYDLLRDFMGMGIKVSMICVDGYPPPAGLNGTVKSKLWTRRYSDVGGKPVPPAGSDPATAWAHCPCRGFFQLRNGSLYKCPTVAYLPDVRACDGPLDPGWDPALGYAPLSSDCPEADLIAFLAEQENPACGVCSLSPSSLNPTIIRR